ncbi:MAG: hypothetical protein LQ340_006908 [Diploschistes diacapsis]|nr:MAG: hypothetical protein LQ340_006908 [Diploschistes diacapsis]
MYARRTVAPLTIDTKSHTEGKGGVFTAATFHFAEQPSAKGLRRRQSVSKPANVQATRARTLSPQKQRSGSQVANMMSFQNASQPPAMFVRALYDYEADDRTSLSFKQGDIIQVITQLESGWWDGIINDVRGWFPSNYCSVVPGQSERNAAPALPSAEDRPGESGTEDEREDGQTVAAAGAHERNATGAAGTQNPQEEEAAFWIPQATPDGRLYYYNTLTGMSTMDLPLETPTQANESGPRNLMTVNAPDQTRPPAELMAGRLGLDRDEDETSSSDIDANTLAHSTGMMDRKRRSQLSDGVSPATSMESLHASPVVRSRNDSKDSSYARQVTNAVAIAPYPGSLLSQYPSAAVPKSFYDDGSSSPVTWNRLIDNMRKSVEAYRQAINNADRSEYVRRAEDISDHLRMILAAGSGTTDNHSGNPSVISTNKALYPHFRDMMSRFSKLVLSSHMAAADWPAPDSYAKCLQEAEGVLHGVYGFVDVARAQRGEDIPRLVPGFVLGSYAGGNWLNNNLGGSRRASSGADAERDSFAEPCAKLDSAIIDRMDDLKRMTVSSIGRLEEHLAVPEKVVDAVRHEQISNAICTSAGKVVEHFRPYISTIESINLHQQGRNVQEPQLEDFGAQKQRLYDLIASLVIACQTVAGPLSDEWAELRGEPLANRVQEVRNITKQLESSMSDIGFLFQQLLRNPAAASTADAVAKRQPDGIRAPQEDILAHFRSRSQGIQQPSRLGDVGHSFSYNDTIGVNDSHRRNPKVEKFFGEVPAGRPDDTPSYLRLDHEGEIAYDTKTDPPQLKGGTLVALVEHLTRHDRPDPHFNATFLLTYRSFTTATELFELLVKRYTIQPPQRITGEDYKQWVEKKQKPIRIRTVNILKSWFDTYWMEGNDEASIELLKMVHSFVRGSVAKWNAPQSGPLLTVIEQRLRGQDSSSKVLVPCTSQTPAPIIPKNMKKMKFLDIDVTEFARQLTIIESKLYGKIRPTECLNKTWQKKINSEDSDPAPNVKAVILHSNQLTNWVAEMILMHADVKKRVIVIKHFVNIADKCRALNNFSTLTSIVSALGTAPINRLGRTWQQVSARTQATLEVLRALIASTKNFAEYRETLHKANPPCIPFLGVFLTDLTFIEDGIPSIFKRTNLINFAKRAKAAEVIRDIQQYQNVPYPLQPVPELQDYITSHMQSASDVSEMYDRSLTVEPREREDEKITRYRKDSPSVSLI